MTTAELRGVTKCYGRIAAVNDVSLTLAPGETVALIGHNGAGKTTLMKLMLGLIRPTAGEVRVLGDNPAAGDFAARRRLGYLPESVAFHAALTGREVQRFYARLKGEPVAEALDLLDKVGLGGAAARRIGTYSKGMRQRLGLAQALIGEPRLLLLDEPTSGLDPLLRQRLFDIIQERARDGATVLLSSHGLTELAERAGRIVIMNGGAVVADGSIDDLRRQAGLPTKIRLKAASFEGALPPRALDPASAYRRINGHVVEIDVAAGRTIDVLRRAVADADGLEDIAVVPPTLDELYAHFLRGPEGV